jgi:hypothetical protein
LALSLFEPGAGDLMLEEHLGIMIRAYHAAAASAVAKIPNMTRPPSWLAIAWGIWAVFFAFVVAYLVAYS